DALGKPDLVLLRKEAHLADRLQVVADRVVRTALRLRRGEASGYDAALLEEVGDPRRPALLLVFGVVHVAVGLDFAHCVCPISSSICALTPSRTGHSARCRSKSPSRAA